MLELICVLIRGAQRMVLGFRVLQCLGATFLENSFFLCLVFPKVFYLSLHPCSLIRFHFHARVFGLKICSSFLLMKPEIGISYDRSSREDSLFIDLAQRLSTVLLSSVSL